VTKPRIPDPLIYPPPDQPDAPRTLRAAGRYFKVNPETVRRWIKSGRLDEFREGRAPARHGTGYSYRLLKCRCPECRDWNAQAQQRHRGRRASAAPGERCVPHGTAGGYSNWMCRCDECRAAHSERVRAEYRSRLERAKVDPSVVPNHGPSGYTGWGCRCEECRAGGAAAFARRQAARKAVAL
jgi:hypothetical protein